VAVPQGVEAPGAAPSGPPLIALTGNLGYFPTVEGMQWWLGAVWPEARRRFEGVRLLLCGARPARSLRDLARRAGAAIEESPADLRAALRKATVAIAPARCGSGMPIKVLEAWAEGVPVIATRWTAAGTTAVPDRDLLVADTPAEWLTALGSLLGAAPQRTRLAAAGRARLREDYGEERLRSRLLALVEEVAALIPPAK
jgi:glycosyltransferase involved in cell wall biosynthesis